jgi:hypothetical protein
MKRPLGAGRILANIQALKGFTTKRELADFFGVGPSAVTDWTNRKGDRIPERRLADASRAHGLNWEWLAYGEGHPYDRPSVDKTTGVLLDPAELELLARVKSSPLFKKAVHRLLGLPEEQLKILGQLAEALNSPDEPERRRRGATISGTTPTSEQGADAPKNVGESAPFLKYHVRYP